MIGLTGAHRTGKTTLGRAFSEKWVEYPFLQTSVSQTFKDMGLDPSGSHSFDVRMDIQNRVLEAAAAQYRSMAGEPFITDRTPIDFLAYTLAEVGPTTLTPELGLRLSKYIKDCINLTNEIFSTLIIVQPGIDVIPGECKGSLSPMYIEHVAHLIMGITASEAIGAEHFFVPRSMTDIDKRIKCIETAICRSTSKHEAFLKSAKDAGRPIVFH